MIQRSVVDTFLRNTNGMSMTPERSGASVQTVMEPTWSSMSPRVSNSWTKSRIPSSLVSTGPQKKVSFATKTWEESDSISMMSLSTLMLSTEEVRIEIFQHSILKFERNNNFIFRWSNHPNRQTCLVRLLHDCLSKTSRTSLPCRSPMSRTSYGWYLLCLEQKERPRLRWRTDPRNPNVPGQGLLACQRIFR